MSGRSDYFGTPPLDRNGDVMHHNQNSRPDSQIVQALMSTHAPANHDLRFRERREAVGLSQRRLAQEVGCSLNTVVNIESGVTRRGVKILRVLEVLEYFESQAA